MDCSPSSKPELVTPQQPSTETTASKRRKMAQKTVIKVKIEENSGKQKSDGPPPDSWSWRKYGQKPIKGSPYPRGYYRCSSSKGCSAKKQVERCGTDASMLIITYTSSHNHPGPDIPQVQPTETPPHVQPMTEDLHAPNNPKSPSALCEEGNNVTEEIQDHPQTPPKCSEDNTTTQQEEGRTESDKTHETPSILFDEDGPLPYPHLMTFTTRQTQPSSEENDFFDELEELPISSSFTSLVRSSFFDERIPLLPS